jgi:polyferredoxin
VADPKPTRWTTLRRCSQIAFLILFVGLLWRTDFAARLFLEADPLVAVGNALATRALYRGLLWSLAILVPILFLGRFFCGWICPLGTLLHFAGSLKSPWNRGARRLRSNRYHPWQTAKYWLLCMLLASALCGITLLLALDPISILVRSLGASVLPALDRWSLRPPHFQQAVLLALILTALLLANLLTTRFWCRALCPLGALLGLASRWSILGLEKNAAACGDCNRCLLHCQGGDDPIPGAKWRKAECHLCLNCVADCPHGGLRFRLFPHQRDGIAAPDLRRRQLVTGALAGFALAPVLRAERQARPLRPPGALEESAFLARCIRCGECLKVCPNNALQPAWSEAGVEGLWTPVLVPRTGYCAASCTLCGTVCPTGAIWEFTAREKGWSGDRSPGLNHDAAPIRVGTAFYDRGRCLPWAMATECIVCEEWCPTSPKTIYLRPAEVAAPDGSVQTVRQPYLDPRQCVGCGACEFACPVRGQPAIYVTSVGESRSPTNQMLLAPAAGAPASSLFPDRAAGWVRTGEARTFDASDLWRYVDGDAERYMHVGIRRTFTTGYRYQDGAEAVADIHEMAASEGARAIFESESAAGSRPAAIGDAARLYGQSLTFRRGRYFVRLTAYQDSAGISDALLALAKAIDVGQALSLRRPLRPPL